MFSPLLAPRPATDSRWEPMVRYAFSAHSYVITEKEADEIIHKEYWEDVDDFCEYMQAVNFGEPISGTTNVVLPSTLRIYTDEDLDLMDQGLFVEPPRDISDVESVVSNYLDYADQESDVESGATNPHIELVDEEEYAEPLPLYVPRNPEEEPPLSEDPPAYVPPEVEPAPRIAEVEEEPFLNKPKFTVSHNLICRLDRKILEAKRKLAKDLKSISPKDIMKRARKVREKLIRGWKG
ncbi:hypothetical protein SUNI508_02589 [Seiridium unicorne]|uniref:Uncharacterized protein n=1 Tax=Seiridium unicorne TaxID=138068 RepID=A0ABR2UFI7_9PEZI